MENRNFAFGKTNFILIGVSILLIIIGFFMMGGSGSTEDTFNPDIFSKTRIVIAPGICFIGFLLVIVGILYKAKDKE
jgi:Protein of unknown function (DUF3098).